LFEYVYVFQKGEMNQKERPYNISKEEFIENDLGVWKIRPVKKIYGKQNGETKNIAHHPCPYPVELPQRIIKLYTYEDALVIDPFGGIGSTSLAAHNTGRNSISVDISKEFCETAYTRLKSENVNVKLG
jgi:site-specific DNA-methyltransferase (adenine-specific)